MKTLEQLCSAVVAERREEYYQEIGRKAQKLRAKRLQQLLEKMGRDHHQKIPLTNKCSV